MVTSNSRFMYSIVKYMLPSPVQSRGKSSERCEQTWYCICSDYREGLQVQRGILKLTLTFWRWNYFF